MARVKLNLRNLSITENIARGRQIVTAMPDNARLPTQICAEPGGGRQKYNFYSHGLHGCV